MRSMRKYDLHLGQTDDPESGLTRIILAIESDIKDPSEN